MYYNKLYFHRDGLERYYGLEVQALLEEMSRSATRATLVDRPADADAVILINEHHINNPAEVIRSLPDRPVYCWDASTYPRGIMNGLYCNMALPSYDPSRQSNFRYIVTYNELIDAFPLEDARHLVGFHGGITAPVRERIVAALSEHPDLASVRVQSAEWDRIFDRSGSETKARYADALRAAKFFVCPRGNGVGSIRLFETMQARRVPVIVSDRYALPQQIDWASCAVVVSEAEVDQIPAICRALEPRWEAMADAARAAYERHFASEQLLDSIATKLSELEPTTMTLRNRALAWRMRSEYALKRVAMRARRFAKKAVGR